MRDQELDELLKPLKKSAPSELQMQRWKSVLKPRSFTFRGKWALQLIAAMFVGVLIGALAFRSTPANTQISLDDTATFQWSHNNLD